MGSDLNGRRDSRWRPGSANVIGVTPDNSLGLYQHGEESEFIKIGRNLERIGHRQANLERGARAGNPVAAEVLKEELGLSLLPPSVPGRCLRCGGRLVEGRCEGRWILAKTDGGPFKWQRCQAVWSVGVPDAAPTAS